MGRLATFLFKKSRSATLWAILFGLLTGVCNTLGIRFINLGIEKNGQADATVVLGFVGVCLLLPISRVISQVLLARLSQKIILELRSHLVHSILSVPLRKLEQAGASKVLTVLTQDVPTISAAMISVPTACMSLAIVLSGFVYMFWMFWPAAVVTLFSVGIGVSVFSLTARKAQQLFVQAREFQGALIKQINGVIHGNKELKQHQARRTYFMDDMFQPTAEAFRRRNVAGMTWFSGAASLGQCILFVTVGLLVFGFPRLFPEVSASVLSGYALILMYMLLPLEGLTNALPQLAMAGVSLRKVEDLGVDFTQATTETFQTVPSVSTWQRVAYQEITHTYYREQENEFYNLGPISLEIKPGELIFIIGGNGSGKTTLAKLLMGLYSPHSGTITLDGNPVEDSNRDQFRQLFSAIFSDYYLFEELMGLCPPEQEQLARTYLKYLQLDQKVSIRDGSLSSIELSTGQRKRLALLLSFLEDRPIYLFDEWAADQDPVFKEVFYTSILSNLKQRGKTVLVISHDDRYFNQADRIIKLEDGRIAIDTTDVHNLALVLQAHS